VELLIAVNPDPDSRLPYLMRLPLGGGMVFRTSGTWPRTKALYCYPAPADEWPADPDIVERVTSVERKSPADLVASLTSGKLRYALAEMAALPRAAVVVEDRYSAIFKLDRVRPALVADGLAEVQVRWPNVPIVFCETRQLAEEWTYRFLAAARSWAETEEAAIGRIMPAGESATGEPGLDQAPAAPEPSTAEVRAWARTQGLPVPDRGRLRPAIWDAWRAAAPERSR